MLSFILECGTTTVGSSARCALRMRVSMSEIGSVIVLPTGFGYTGNQAIEGGFAKRQTRTGKFAQITVASAAHGAAVDQTGRAGVARQFGQPGVIAFGFEFRAQSRVFFDRRGLLLVPFEPCLFCHIIFLRRRACPSVLVNPAPRHRWARW